MDANIHRVTEIRFDNIERLGNSGFTRHIVIVGEDGRKELELTCFSDDKETLKVRVTKEI